MSYLNALISDLRDRKLWPVALVLVAALVAVPVVLSKTAQAPPARPLPSLAMPVTASNTGAAVSVELDPTQTPLHGKQRDPFTQQKLAAAAKALTTTPSTGIASGASASTGTTGSGGGAGSSSGSTGSTGSTGGGSVTVTPPVLPPNPVPSGGSGTKSGPASSALRPTQSYEVTLAETGASGSMKTFDSLTRLSVLPSSQLPRLVELGVLQGGRRVLFAVLPGTTLTGTGGCTPGPLDCEVLSLAVNQTEGISVPASSGYGVQVLIAVTAISAVGENSVTAANRARRSFVAAGQRLLDENPLNALSLFQYQPSLGALVDLRNLTVGGN